MFQRDKRRNWSNRVPGKEVPPSLVISFVIRINQRQTTSHGKPPSHILDLTSQEIVWSMQQDGSAHVHHSRRERNRVSAVSTNYFRTLGAPQSEQSRGNSLCVDDDESTLAAHVLCSCL